MPATDSPAVLVARFLKANNYLKTYDAFVAEAGLSPDAGNVSRGDLTIEQVLEEKKTFDVSLQFEKLGVAENGEKGWRLPAPNHYDRVVSLPVSANILSVHVARAMAGESAKQALFVTTADRRLHLLDAATRNLLTSLSSLHDSPILSTEVFRERYLLSASMSGQLIASDVQGIPMEKRRDHSKYIVKVAVFDEGNDDALIATAGWDMKVIIYRPSISGGKFTLGEPIATITLQTKPEAILFFRHPKANKPVLLLSRTDSNHLHFYAMPGESEDCRMLGRQNLAPHSNAWVAFTPSALAISPIDPLLLAAGTSSVPHMKLLLTRLLIPPYDQVASENHTASLPLRRSLLDDENLGAETQASQARRELAIADREAAAIEIHCNTMAPQTAYSTPAVAWRPDGSGIWVNGDDGAVRGVEATTGKVVTTLQGHEEGSKVRCLWAGEVEGQEMLVSGGFDQRLILWTVSEAS